MTDSIKRQSPQEVTEARAMLSSWVDHAGWRFNEREAANLRSLLTATAPVDPSGDLVEDVAMVGFRRVRAMYSVGTAATLEVIQDATCAVLSHLAALGMGEAE